MGFPAITVVTTTSQSATNDGDDEGENTQTTSADVKPDVDASVVPKCPPTPSGLSVLPPDHLRVLPKGPKGYYRETTCGYTDSTPEGTTTRGCGGTTA